MIDGILLGMQVLIHLQKLQIPSYNLTSRDRQYALRCVGVNTYVEIQISFQAWFRDFSRDFERFWMKHTIFEARFGPLTLDCIVCTTNGSIY